MEVVDNSEKPSGSPFTNPNTWKRGLVTLVFLVAFGIAQSLLFFMTLAQFVWLLFKQEPNRPIAEFGQSLGVWLSEVAAFLVCATNEKPFPWKGWP